MFSIIEAYYITAWISLYIALQTLFFSGYIKDKKLYLIFAAISFFAGMYQFYSGRYYEANTLENAIYALKLQFVFAALFISLLYSFISIYTGVRVRKTILFFLLFILIITLIANYLSTYSMRFETITTATSFTLPWGERITNYTGDTNFYIIFLRVIYTAVLVWGMWRVKVHYSKNSYESILFGMFVVFSILAAWIGALIDTNQINFVYSAGFAYFFLTISMAATLGVRIFNQQKELENMTQELHKEISFRQKIEGDLIFNERHDELTGLSNRRMILERLDEAIKDAKRYSSRVAVLFIDLDHFNGVNDSLGHVIGDKVLLEVSKNIVEHVRTIDNLARLSGDEFCLLIPSVESADDATNVATRLLDVLQQPVFIDKNKIYLTGSIGISIYPNDGQTPIELLRNAGSAMYKAKEEGNSYHFYKEEMTKLAFEKLGLENYLRRALELEEFIIYYQPQIDGRNNQFTGMEALIRWNHPEKGIISPSEYIPYAVSTGLIVPIDRYILKTGMEQLYKWHEMGLNHGIVAFNLTIKQMKQDDFISFVQAMILQTKCRPEWIEFELSEGEIMDRPEETILILQQLHKIGIKIAIDDFGTGYSSLSYLKKLPVDKIKIDQSFVRDIPDNQEDIAVVKTIIALSQSLHMEVIAEGVENNAQKLFLIENGCSNIQGYLYGRPMPAIEMTKFLMHNG